jgi:hypothetical protein
MCMCVCVCVCVCVGVRVCACVCVCAGVQCFSRVSGVYAARGCTNGRRVATAGGRAGWATRPASFPRIMSRSVSRDRWRTAPQAHGHSLTLCMCVRAHMCARKCMCMCGRVWACGCVGGRQVVPETEGAADATVAAAGGADPYTTGTDDWASGACRCSSASVQCGLISACACVNACWGLVLSWSVRAQRAGTQ